MSAYKVLALYFWSMVLGLSTGTLVCHAAVPLPLKEDLGMLTGIISYTAAVTVLDQNVESLAQAYQAMVIQTKRIDQERQKQRAREVFAASYLELNTLYAQYLIAGLNRLIARNRLLSILPMTPSLSDAQQRIDYLERQINFIQLFGVLLFKKTHERGKVLFVATVLINKLTRVIVELAQRIYDIKIFYTILRAVFYSVAQKDDLLSTLDQDFFGISTVLNKFSPIIDDPSPKD